VLEDGEAAMTSESIGFGKAANPHGTISHSKGGTTFTGKAVDVFAMLALASGLELYATAKIIPNRAYTPTNMLRMAEKWTGLAFKRGQYLLAADALRAKAKELRATCEEVRS
jgi:hypothetical protein